jgi:AcrR family transcriptional regulator
VDDRDRYDEKLTRILRGAASIFARKGYHQASIRDIAAETQISLAGLYYYFRSKEELLFLIQDHCFTTLLERVGEAVERESDPEEQLRVFVRIHLSFFVASMDEMKVLSHEAQALTGDFRTQVQGKKRRYVSLVDGILDRLRPADSGLPTRISTLSLFGMLNWIYTWYRPDRDPAADLLADQMTHIFLHGFLEPGPADASSVPGSPAPSLGQFWPET